MRKASHIVFSLLLVVASLTFETGCGKVPKLTPVQLVQLISSQVPADLIVAGSISSLAGNPDLAAVFTKIGNAASQDLPLIKIAADTWLANQTSGNFAALAAVCGALSNKLTPQLLAANGLASTDAEKIIVASVSVFVLGISAWSVAFSGFGVKTAANFHQIIQAAKLTPMTDVYRIAREYGTTPAELGF